MALRDQCADAGVPFFMKQMTAEEVDSRSANGAPIPRGESLTTFIEVTDNTGTFPN